MAHILIGGDLSGGPDVRSLLRQWGMTFGKWSAENSGSSYPTTDECDALIIVLPWIEIPALDLGGATDAPLAPLLLLGNNPGRVLLARDAQRVLPDPGPDGVDLKFALGSCMEQANLDRGLEEEKPQSEDQEGYLHFLGHELRSPLTAAKTALEVLQGELGGMLSVDSCNESASVKSSAKDARLMMLDIALRNIKRLHRTVDWSQDLLKLEASSTVGKWIEVPVENLVEEADQLADLVVEEDALGRCLESDPNLLRVLVGQMTKVLDYALPGSPVAGLVRLDPTRERGLDLVLRARPTGDEIDGPRIARTYLASADGPSDCTASQELEKLAGFVISRPLLEQLQAEVVVESDDDGTPGLVLRLVLATKGQDATLAEDPPVLLHAPA